MNWYIAALKKYATITGRSSRKEFWIFTLVTYLISYLMFLIIIASGEPEKHLLTFFWMIYGLAMTIPFYATGIRRLHDTNHSGWWILVPVYSLYLLCKESSPDNNEYGEAL